MLFINPDEITKITVFKPIIAKFSDKFEYFIFQAKVIEEEKC